MVKTVGRIAVAWDVKARAGLTVGEIQSEESIRLVELILLKDTIDNLRCRQLSATKVGSGQRAEQVFPASNWLTIANRSALSHQFGKVGCRCEIVHSTFRINQIYRHCDILLHCHPAPHHTT